MEEPFVINLGDDMIAWVDQQDAEVAGMGWKVMKAGYKSAGGVEGGHGFHYYAVSYHRIGKQSIVYYLHNLIWERYSGLPVPKGFLVDHINGDKMDNRRENLRLATRTENEANKKKRRTHGKDRELHSKYKGVSKMTDGRKKCWRVTITSNGVQRNVGNYYSEREAALAYNEAAKQLFGNFALLNEVEDEAPK